jgi:hypothetical protein
VNDNWSIIVKLDFQFYIIACSIAVPKLVYFVSILRPVSIFGRRDQHMAGLTDNWWNVSMYDSTHDSRKNGAERRHRRRVQKTLKRNGFWNLKTAIVKALCRPPRTFRSSDVVHCSDVKRHGKVGQSGVVA